MSAAINLEAAAAPTAALPAPHEVKRAKLTLVSVITSVGVVHFIVVITASFQITYS
jgi:hypothetical protein